MWQIRKQEKLLEEEKKKLKRDTQECTFSPRLNQNSLSKQLSPYDIYERGIEWNEKVQHALTDKREKRYEEIRVQIHLSLLLIFSNQIYLNLVSSLDPLCQSQENLKRLLKDGLDRNVNKKFCFVFLIVFQLECQEI